MKNIDQKTKDTLNIKENLSEVFSHNILDIYMNYTLENLSAKIDTAISSASNTADTIVNEATEKASDIAIEALFSVAEKSIEAISNII